MEQTGSLSPLVTTIFGIIVSLLVEQVPVFARWWDGLTNDVKKSYRGLAGLVITVILAVLHYTQLVDLGLGSTISVIGIMTLIMSWVQFVLGAEVVYQLVGKLMPRKIEEDKYDNYRAG